jgi:hypothetical protein
VLPVITLCSIRFESDSIEMPLGKKPGGMFDVAPNPSIRLPSSALSPPIVLCPWPPLCTAMPIPLEPRSALPWMLLLPLRSSEPAPAELGNAVRPPSGTPT